MKKRSSRLLSALVLAIMTQSSAHADSRIRFGDFYVGETFQAGIGMRPDLKLSEKIQGLAGQRVEILGFMDGILPRDGMHFMLIKEPSFLCPFHAVSFDWAGFIPIFLNKATDYMDGPVRVVGRLDVGPKTDETGLLSYVRVYSASIQRATK
jgi:hypothetical protein